MIHSPDFLFQVAANSTTRHGALFEKHETISTGSLNILAYSIENWLKSLFGLIEKNRRVYVRIREGFTPEEKCLVSNP